MTSEVRNLLATFFPYYYRNSTALEALFCMIPLVLSSIFREFSKILPNLGIFFKTKLFHLVLTQLLNLSRWQSDIMQRYFR